MTGYTPPSHCFSSGLKLNWTFMPLFPTTVRAIRGLTASSRRCIFHHSISFRRKWHLCDFTLVWVGGHALHTCLPQVFERSLSLAPCENSPWVQKEACLLGSVYGRPVLKACLASPMSWWYSTWLLIPLWSGPQYVFWHSFSPHQGFPRWDPGDRRRHQEKESSGQPLGGWRGGCMYSQSTHPTASLSVWWLLVVLGCNPGCLPHCTNTIDSFWRYILKIPTWLLDMGLFGICASPNETSSINFAFCVSVFGGWDCARHPSITAGRLQLSWGWLMVSTDNCVCSIALWE